MSKALLPCKVFKNAQAERYGVTMGLLGFRMSKQVNTSKEKCSRWAVPQVPFSTPGRSMLKTTMGMLGEYEYDTVYNEFEVPPITWALCVLFLIINSTILMNLLVSEHLLIP